MAQKNEKLIEKSFFDSENFEHEAKKRKDLVQPVNDFLELCEPFGFTFQDTGELEQFVQQIERFGSKPVYDRLVNKLMESQATIAGFEMNRQALLDSVTFPDPEPIPHKLKDIRVAAKGNLTIIKELELDSKGNVYLPDEVLETLEKQHTVQADNEDQAQLMSALELTADHISNLQSLYRELNVEARAQSRKPLLDYVKNGYIEPSAFRVIKALK
jgi:hypothetical protein